MATSQLRNWSFEKRPRLVRTFGYAIKLSFENLFLQLEKNKFPKDRLTDVLGRGQEELADRALGLPTTAIRQHEMRT
jgi:hypothetical protein